MERDSVGGADVIGYSLRQAAQTARFANDDLVGKVDGKPQITNSMRFCHRIIHMHRMI